MKSVRTYLIVALLATVTLGNFVAAVFGYRFSMAETEALLDAQLADTAALLEATRTSASGIVNPASERMAFQIWTNGGELVIRSQNSGAQPFSDFTEGYGEKNFEGYRWRVLSHPDRSNRRWILVAERIDIRDQLADGITLNAVVPIVASLPIIAAIVWLVVGNGLSLVKRLAQELRNKKADDLSRLHIEDPPTELAPVVDAINDLLRRLNDSVIRERRFSADAAHELRTPISAIKVHLHNLRKEMPERKSSLQLLDRDLGRLSHLIEQMLLLYRMSPEQYQSKMQPIEVYALAQSVISDLYGDIESKGQTISLEGSFQTITGDGESLAILLRNLIGNASKYSSTGDSITVEVGRNDFGVSLGVRDTGPGIPLAEINRIFDRFYRVGGDRHNSSVEGCGLGLAIVRHIADLHHGNLHAENNSDGAGLSITVTFPAETQSPLFVDRGIA